MAPRIRTRTSALYEQDLYVWSKAQVELLRAGRLAELDLAHLILEIEDAGAGLYREVRSRVRTSIEHPLKIEHSPAAGPRARWERTIRTQRADLGEDLTPTLRPRVARNLGKFYEVARIEAQAALRAHGEQAAADALPEACPYSLAQITGDWLPK